jgi:hypothetical protein
MCKYLGIRFKDGDAFPAEEPLARWLTVCAMALNDLLLVNRWLVPRLSGEIDASGGETVYLGRLAASHFFEVAKFLEKSDAVDDIRQFVSGLDPDVQGAYEKVKAAGSSNTSGFAKDLARARNQFFHYSELLPQAEDYERLKVAMEGHAESIGEIRERGPVVEGFRASFADDIAVELSFPESEVDLPGFVAMLADHIAAYLQFGFGALPAWIRSRADDSWEYIEGEQ